MERPIIACDVSKGSSHIQGFIGLSNPECEPFVVRHLKQDLKLIKELAIRLEKKTKIKPAFVFEFTGIYHECIVNYVQLIGLEAYAISPLESAKVRKSKIRTTKTDAKDCLNIATVFYTRKIRLYSNDLTDVKALSRYKRTLKMDLIRQKCAYHRYVDLIWPCFDEYFDLDTKFSQLIIGTYKHPYVLKKRSVNQIASMISNNYGATKTRLFDLTYKLKEYIDNCVSGVPINSAYVTSLTNALNEVKELNSKMEEINFKMDSMLRRTDVYLLLKSIPGCGENTLLQMTAEIGNWRRFKSPKQLIAFCGLDPSILQSGIDDGEHYSITRKGNSILRSCLYLIVQSMIGFGLKNQITEFYYKKKSSGLSHKVAAVASCRKLLCCIYGMLNNGTCFETK